jgi:cobalt-zinc-cadmium efflux system protein
MPHEHHLHALISRRKRGIFWTILLNFGFSLLELAAGILTNSLAVISSAVHDFADALSFVLSYWGVVLAEKPPTKRFTFGYQKAPIFIAFVNAVALIVVTLFIIAEAATRIAAPERVMNPFTVAAIAAVGIAVNGSAALLLARDRKSLNIRSAMLHLMADLFGWLSVLVMAIVLQFTDWYFLDPLLTFAISAMIIWESFKVVREGTEALLDVAPAGVTYNAIKVAAFAASPDITDIHDLHVWRIGEDETSISMHCVIKKVGAEEAQKILENVKAIIRKNFGIAHTVVELERECPKCSDGVCVPRHP